ncbi:hypothetical protein BC835DRAFT_1290306 [Cytidiella melzeri]|nr:hypothetical protein BC835DRAFT_1290306 [Cytidiella melzeri]
MAKKKNKQIIRPWCWYCEREFEDEKVLMQHQKAKHFKCNMCPRRLNTAGGLAVHIQQVHKLEAENLPRIENALPGRDGYEVEIFGMEGIPAPDVADYKRRKEIELGLNPGTISQPPAKRPKVENKPLSEQELKAQLEAHKALMGASETANAHPSTEASSAAVYGAPQAYATPPVPVMSPPGVLPPPGAPSPFPPPFPVSPFPPGMIPSMPPPGFPGFPPMPPGFPMPPPGIGPPGIPPFPMMPGARPPFPPPPFLPQGAPPPGFTPPVAVPTPAVAPTFVPASIAPPPNASVTPSNTTPGGSAPPPELRLPNPALAQTNTPFKKATELKWSDANFSPEEHRAIHPKYYVAPDVTSQGQSHGEESRGKKRARAEDLF